MAIVRNFGCIECGGFARASDCSVQCKQWHKEPVRRHECCLWRGRNPVDGEPEYRRVRRSYGLGLALAGCLIAAPVGNANVPEPSKNVDLKRYAGEWFELARYDNGFERGCEGVTAEYAVKPTGEVRVINTCREGSATGPIRRIEGSAKVVDGSGNAKLNISFFGPLCVGNYWIIDRASDYSWSIVGEPSGRYLWLLSRTKSKSNLAAMTRRAKAIGYDTSLLRVTAQ
jgi:apolipoprotein D and lipocalin family protein